RLGHPLLPILSTCCRGAMSSSGTPAGLSPGEIDDRLLNTVDDSTTHPGEALRQTGRCRLWRDIANALGKMKEIGRIVFPFDPLQQQHNKPPITPPPAIKTIIRIVLIHMAVRQRFEQGDPALHVVERLEFLGLIAPEDIAEE